MMIIFERDKPKNIIIWSVVFVLTHFVGYAIYVIIRHVFYKKRNSLKVKQKEDEIYAKLISSKVYNNKANFNHPVFDFNALAFNTEVTANNNYEIITDFVKLEDDLISSIANAKKYILFELTKANANLFSKIKEAIIDKVKNNIEVKFVYDRYVAKSLIKELKRAGAKAYRFSKHNTVGRVYANFRNAISVDGEVCYLANFNITNKQMNSSKDKSNMFIKVKGDVVQYIDVALHKDTIFASGKFVEYTQKQKQEYNNNNFMQYVTNQINNDLELVLIKAICTAQKSVQLQLAQFIPTESIMSLLKFAINSNIEVRLMVPLKNNRHGKYFASRAYAKQLALMGANVYLFDGYINYNAITIDNEYVISGSYVVDREHLNTSPQSMLLIKDSKSVKIFNDIFDNCVDNSYRINNAKIMLLREKFFKNFV